MPTHADGYLIPFTAPQITAMEIRNFRVRDGSHPTEARRVDENTMVRTFFVKWTERFNFCELVLGDSKTWTDAVGPTVKLSRLLPDSTYGRHPIYTQIIATRIEEIKGHGAGRDDITSMPAYSTRTSDCAEITVFYEHAPFIILSDAGTTTERQRFVTIGDSVRGEAEAFTLPGAAFKYTNAGATGGHGTPLPFNISFTRPIERFTLWWEMIPFSLCSDGGALYKRLYFGEDGGGGTPDGIPFIGTTNSEIFEVTSAGQKYNPGQLLLESVERVKVRSPLAGPGISGMRYRVGLNYAFTPRGWLDLFFFDPATPANSGWYRPTVDGTYYAANALPDETGLYNTRDHNDLFDPDY